MHPWQTLATLRVLPSFSLDTNNCRMEEKGTMANILILDCCRKFKYVRDISRSWETPLDEPVPGKTNSVTALACAPNGTSWDNINGSHGKLVTSRKMKHNLA